VTCAFPPGIHVVALFIDRAIRMHMSVEDTVDAIHDAGGLAVVAHPFMPTWFASITEGRLRRLLEQRTIDGIEVRHTAPVLPGTWKRLDEFCAAHRERVGRCWRPGTAISASTTWAGWSRSTRERGRRPPPGHRGAHQPRRSGHSIRRGRRSPCGSGNSAAR